MISLNSLSMSDILKWNNEYAASFNEKREALLNSGVSDDEALYIRLFKENRDLYEGYDDFRQCQKILDLNERAKKQKLKSEVRAFVTSNREEIISSGGSRCYVCGYNFAQILEIHHVMPIKDGGNNSLDNLVSLCPTCHRLVHNLERNLKNKQTSWRWFSQVFEEWSHENLTHNKSMKLISLGYHCKELKL